MKRILLAFVGFVGILMLIPLLIVAIMGGFADNSRKDGELIRVYFADEDQVKEINTSEYLVGVVAAEMAAEFDEEALKAQAVAARTYMEYHKARAAEHKDNAVVCTDYKHCQAWTNIHDKMESWGDSAKQYKKKIEQAVSDTAGEIITYQNEPINAVFFSTSSGRTENAGDVWGEDFPYLVSVESPGEENAPNFMSEVNLPLEEVKQKISENFPDADFSKGLFTNIVRSDAGGIRSLDIGGVLVKGTQLRSAFSLKSTNVQISEENGNVIFRVKGNGHGVGMSQYGAEAMARNGSNYREILQHYYAQTDVTKGN